MSDQPNNRRWIRWTLLAVIAVLTAVLPVTQALAAAGIWQSYIVINGVFYDANASTGNPDFQNQDLGTFAPGSASLLLNGGQVKTFKNNGTDILSARLMYRVYPTSSPSGSFTAISLPWAADLGGSNQQWEMDRRRHRCTR